MSIQLVLSHYLAGLRERDELDALLPELLKAMGHSVVSRPQVGVAQAGVDVVSTHSDDEGNLEVYLFVIKFGDVGRDDFYGGKQSIDPSIREAANDFVRNRLPENLRGARKRIVLLTNGVLKQEAQAGYAALSHDVAERPKCSLEFWGTDQLTQLIEENLFDENLLLAKGKSDLRAALAGLEESGTAVHRFIRFVDSCFVTTPGPTQSEAVRKKKFLKRCAAASMGWAVLLVWGQSEGNLKPGVIAGEYLALRMWSEAVKEGFAHEDVFAERLASTLSLQVKALLEYFEKVLPQLTSKRAVLAHRPERILYADLVVEELGRLASLSLLLRAILPTEESLRTSVRERLIEVANEHGGVLLPVYDGHTIDITLVLAALMEESDCGNAKRLLSAIAIRLKRALQSGQYLPVDTDLLEDAFAVHVTKEAEPREFFQTSTLFPALATVAALTNEEDTLRLLREEIHPLLQDVTLERWYPTMSLETMTGSRKTVQDVGVSRAIAGVRATTAAEKEASLSLADGAAAPSDFAWHDTPMIVLVALSARLHRHPVPTWFLQMCAAEHAAQAPQPTPAGDTSQSQES
jgi:hypothetical protein